MQIEPYIFFHGTCEDALTFYAGCFDGEIVGLTRMKDAPPEHASDPAWADAAEAERVFAALAEGGTVEAPLAKQFWGGTFGQLVDRFGIQWMVTAP